ncbi:hypothetical protein MESS4_790091 [Mesorhizobium sp. STM 4661]|nr:hypothetical protein MESS4_790091 [Mesorhizobium sp. STM 4661]
MLTLLCRRVRSLRWERCLRGWRFASDPNANWSANWLYLLRSLLCWYPKTSFRMHQGRRTPPVCCAFFLGSPRSRGGPALPGR